MPEDYADFSASRDLVDSLKLELSIATPSEAEGRKELVRQAGEVLLARYGQYIPENNTEDRKGAEDRVLDLSWTRSRTFMSEWEGYKGYPDSPSIVTKQGRISTSFHPINQWELLGIEEREKLARLNGGEEKAKEQVNKLFNDYALIHETVHQFQDGRLPYLFREGAAWFYTTEVAQELGLEELDIEAIRFYRGLYTHVLDQRGDDAHKVFFGSKLNFWKRRKVLSVLPDLRAEQRLTKMTRRIGRGVKGRFWQIWYKEHLLPDWISRRLPV